MTRNPEARRKQVAEAKRRFDDKFASIDTQLNSAIQNIDHKRRKFASKSLNNFIQTYFVGSVLDTAPSELTIDLIRNLEKGLLDSRPLQIECQRGAGKTTLSEIAIVWLLVTGRRKFCVIVSHDANAAKNILNDIWRMVSDESDLMTDYPEVLLPLKMCAGGSFRRKQTYNGISTNITKTSSTIVFPRIVDSEGKDIKTSACAITTRGIGSGIRGIKLPSPTGRPDVVLIDDILDAESAMSEEQNKKIWDIIHKDVMNLSSGKKLGCVATCTPLCEGDITQMMEKSSIWRTLKYPAIIQWPDDMVQHPNDGIWAKYKRLWMSELDLDKPHDESLNYLKENFNEAHKGAVTFQDRFNQNDGHISGLQALLEKKWSIGDAAFDTEMQLKVHHNEYALEVTPRDVISNCRELARGTIPDGTQFLIASSDLNVSKYITTTILAFMRDGSCHVVDYIFKRTRILGTVADSEYNKALYDALVEHGKEIHSKYSMIRHWAIDANGLAQESVLQFTNASIQLCGLVSHAFFGRSSFQWTESPKSKLRTPISRTVECGDALETLKSGKGHRWVLFDSDFYHETVQVAILRKVGMAGSLTLFSGPDGCHTEFARQLCGERLLFKSQKPNGRFEYHWKSSTDHDVLDSLGQGYAMAAQMGISSESFSRQQKRRFVPYVRKKKYVFH